MKPRTLCGCQSVASTISAIDAPLGRRSIIRTSACLVVTLLAFGFGAFAALAAPLRTILGPVGLVTFLGMMISCLGAAVERPTVTDRSPEWTER